MNGLLRWSMWLLAALTIVLQAGFLVELHSPQAVSATLWSLFVASVISFIMFLYVRTVLSSIQKWR
jgi:hypothetical protein